jgi:hypothetical protein
MGATQRLTAVMAIALATLVPVRAQAQGADPAGGGAAPADTSRMFLLPTGRMLAPGQGYIAFDGPILATVEVGVTQRVSMGGGTMLFWFGDAGKRPAWITPKVQVYANDRTSVAAGVIHGFVPGEGRAGFAYVVGTHGTIEQSVTVGSGVFYGDVNDDGRGATVSLPVVLIGGERRFKPRVSFITENEIGLDGGLVLGGFRWRFQHWQLNVFGGMSFVFDVMAMPTLGVTFAYKFGNK